MTIVAGEGSWLETDQGVRLLDATAGLWHANIGHGRERAWSTAAAAQMRRLETYDTFGNFVNDQAVALADRVAAMSPIEDSRVFFVSSAARMRSTPRPSSRAASGSCRGETNKRIIISREWGVPRAARVRHLDRWHPVQPRGIRLGVADPQDRPRAGQRRRRAGGRDQAPGPGPGRGGVRRADHRHRRRDPARRRVPAARRGPVGRLAQPPLDRRRLRHRRGLRRRHLDPVHRDGVRRRLHPARAAALRAQAAARAGAWR